MRVRLCSVGNRRFLLLVLLILSCLLASFPIHASMDKVRLRLVWKNQFQFAGYYVAKEKGFYAQAGLDVEILEKELDIDNAQELLSGKTEFAVGRSSILINRARGDDVVALMAVFQNSPMMLLTLGNSGISEPASLLNTRIMFTQESTNVSEVLAMLIQAGISRDEYVHLKHSFSLKDLVNGKTDAMAAYVSNEPFQLEKSGVKFNVIHPKDHGFNMYSDILFTSGKMVKQQPDLVEKFYHASLLGWLYAFDNIEETVSIILEKYNSQNRSKEALLFEAKALKELAFDEEGKFGSITMERLQQMLQIYLLTNIVDKDVDISGFIYEHPVRKFRISSKELQYVRANPIISVCVNQDWMPYEGIDHGTYKGMVADYMHLLQDRLGLIFHIVPADSISKANTLIQSGKCEVISAAIPTIRGNRSYNLTTPYLSVPAVIATNASANIKDSFPESISVVKGTAFEEIVQTRYPDVRIISVDNGRQGLELVQKEEVEGYLGTRARVNTLAAKHSFDNIVINESFRDVLDVSVAVNNGGSLLLGLLDKAIRSITHEEKHDITSRWINIKPPGSISPDLIWKVLFGVAIIILLAAYRHSVVWRHNKKLSEIAGTDWLTQLPNRHRIIDKLEMFLNHSKRYSRTVSIIYFDIDDFKSINDKYGHATGDEVLQQLAKLMERETRNTDVSGRWGGEEFVLVSPEANLKESVKVADKLRKLIEAEDFGIPIGITCSFGVAEYITDEPLESFVNRADEALYKAKNRGKNSVVAYAAG